MLIISEQNIPDHQEDTKADIDAYVDDEVNDPDFDPKEPEFEPKPANIQRLVIPKLKPKICKSNDWAKNKLSKTSPSKKVRGKGLDLKKSTEFEDYQKRVKRKMDALDPDYKYRVNGCQKKEKDKSAESFTKIAIDLNTKEFRCMKCKDVKGKNCDFTKNLEKFVQNSRMLELGHCIFSFWQSIASAYFAKIGIGIQFLISCITKSNCNSTLILKIKHLFICQINFCVRKVNFFQFGRI